MANYLVESWSSSSDSSGSDEEETWYNNTQSHLNLSNSELTSAILDINITNMVTLDEPSIFLQLTHLNLSNNLLEEVPSILGNLASLTKLDLGNNNLHQVPDSITNLVGLNSLVLKNNRLDESGLPKDMIGMKSLKTLNLSGNQLTCIPPQILDIVGLRNLFLGANSITQINPSINRLRRLKMLYIGGNLLEMVPEEIGDIPNLQILILSDNRIRRVPDSICHLRKLKCLHLHRNRITTMPHGLIHIKSLNELSLRENPLVMRFIRDMEHQPASLIELAARVIRQHRIPYGEDDIPASLHKYLAMAHECVNPNCKGVYFDHRVEHVKFSDFCGKYKVPLLQYLCSPRCREQLPEYADCEVQDEFAQDHQRLKRVLLG